MAIPMTTFKVPEAQVADILDYIKRRFAEFPLIPEHDADFFMELIEDFDECDVLEELKRFRAWNLDHPRQKRNYRSSFRSWLERARGYKIGRNMR